MNARINGLVRNLQALGAASLLLLGAMLLVVPARAAHAGVGFGIAVDGGGFSFVMGYRNHPVYSPAWNQPGLAIRFETYLSGYGEWVTITGMGRVWKPWVLPSWRPYTWGRWVYTSYGWTWVAYEPWGYVPHHYGSWAMTSYGWVWRPGYVYRPAHVTWIRYGSHVGWYPAPPYGWSQSRHAWWPGYRSGHRNGFREGYNVGYARGWEDARYANFVRWDQMAAGNIAEVAIPGERFRGLGPATVRPLQAPPSVLRVQRAVGRPIPSVRVSERSISMNGRTVRAVRPAGVEESIARYSVNAARGSMAPSVVRDLDRRARELTPESRRGASRSVTRPPASRQLRRPAARRISETREIAPRGSSRRPTVRSGASGTRRSSANAFRVPRSVSRAPDKSRTATANTLRHERTRYGSGYSPGSQRPRTRQKVAGGRSNGQRQPARVPRSPASGFSRGPARHASPSRIQPASSSFRDGGLKLARRTGSRSRTRVGRAVREPAGSRSGRTRRTAVRSR